MVAATQASIEQIWAWLAEIPDPEVPAVSIVDLGIVREVRWSGEQQEECMVTVTPTYSGCPATEMIARQIRESLAAHGIERAQLQIKLSPAWTTDWMSAAAKEKLRAYGIAPPGTTAAEALVTISGQIACPRCGSKNTALLSQFGSTPCKALYRCHACLEPFDYFKTH
jgi:ring-1,2-phenylacetyl-CoA epoxidase subunit PaaD